MQRQRWWKRVSVLGVLVAAIPGAVCAQNLLVNPSFDADASSWQLVVGADLLWTDILDASGCASSGSALIPSASDD
ncbi:MAG: hypothetical protein ABIU84_16145, partial [Thermoanaerobaculia bacterium]